MRKEDLNMFNSGYSIEMYKMIESDFIDFISYVPLEENHLDVYSPRLADIINRCCSQIETFFKEWLILPSLDHLDNIQTYRNMKLEIENYRNFFEPRLRLSEHCIFVKTLDKYISPFEEFSKKGKAPRWWTVHNKLKHRAYENRKEATLEMALYAVAALFFLNKSNSSTTYGLNSSLENQGILRWSSLPPAIESLER